MARYTRLGLYGGPIFSNSDVDIDRGTEVTPPASEGGNGAVWRPVHGNAQSSWKPLGLGVGHWKRIDR